MPVLESLENSTQHADVHVDSTIACAVEPSLRLEAFDQFAGDGGELDVAEVPFDHLETLAVEFDRALRIGGRLLRGQELVAGVEQSRRSTVSAELAVHGGSDQVLFELDRLLPLRCCAC